MTGSVIVGSARTPIGKALRPPFAGLSAIDLSAGSPNQGPALERAGCRWLNRSDYVLMGQVLQGRRRPRIHGAPGRGQRRYPDVGGPANDHQQGPGLSGINGGCTSPTR